MQRWLEHPLARLVELGTAGYPLRIRRRLKSLNALAALIVVSSGAYALSYAMTDAQTYRWIIAINLGLIAMAVCVPLLHRVSEILGGLVIAGTECAALFALVALLGRDSGIQLNLIVGAAAGFFILGLEHLVLSLAIVGLCFALHVAAWFLFPLGLVPVEPGFLAQLYVSSALTTFGLSAAIAYYAFRLAERAEAETERLLRNILPGTIVAGVIGTRKFSYDVWGDAVNLAARLESSGEPERVQLSPEARGALTAFDCEPRGQIEIKGLGPLETWFLSNRRAAA